MKQAIPIGAVILGFVLLGLSTIWTSFVRAESTWTEDKAKRLSDVQARLPYLGAELQKKPSMHSGPDKGTIQAEFEALKKEQEQLNSEFNSVAERPGTVKKVLKWSGISLAALGLIGWYAAKQTS